MSEPNIANGLLTAFLSDTAKSKPDRAGFCNANKCMAASVSVIGRTLPNATGLTKALSSNDLNRILKTADMLEQWAKDLRDAVAWVREGHNGHT